LEAEISKLSLQDTVRLCGALPHDKVIDLYHQASIFVLPAVEGSDGDRDGIPNVILEAMASGLPVISTRHSGIPEVVEDGSNGVLVPPGDDIALATAMAHLFDHPDLGQKLAQKGVQTVIEKFALERNVEQLLEEFMAAVQTAPIPHSA
jgi:glycosyltransferase involved in cell wall biosynthesis